MICKLCKQNSITPVGTCSNMDCVSNKNREMTSLDILEGHIDKGTPPNAVGTEYNNEGIIRTVFRWKCGTFLYMRYELSAYLITLARFMDFWGTCLPGSEFEVKEKEGGKSGGH